MKNTVISITIFLLNSLFKPTYLQVYQIQHYLLAIITNIPLFITGHVLNKSIRAGMNPMAHSFLTTVVN